MKNIVKTIKNSALYFSLSIIFTFHCNSQVLEVKGNNTVISNGDITPSLTDFTDFGSVPNGNKFSRTFVLKNTGASTLTFPNTATSVVLSGTNANQFFITTSVIINPLSLTANTYCFIEVSFNPTSVGSKTATLTIDPSNGTPSTYSFSITGTATSAVSSDFTRTTLSPSFSYPFALIYGPDDYLWLTERGGKKINRVKKDGTVVDLLLNMDTLVYYGAITKQDGLLGMALHPNLGKGTGEDYVYVAYTYGTSSANESTRIVRYTYTVSSNDGTLSSPMTLIEGLSASDDHNSGKLVIGPDLKLYYTVGDQGANQFGNKCEVIRSQDIPTLAMLNAVPPNYNYYEGKTLRLNLDGSIPDDNPVINTVRSHIFTYGHRNAQGLVFGKNGKLYSSEHGPKSDDELNILQSGGNYGWPNIAGFKDNKNYEYCNWSSASNCSSLTFNDYTCGAGISSVTESSWSTPFINPITTFFTIDNGFNFTGNWLSWPSIGPSSAKMYEGFTSQIPDWDNSILITTLKKGRIYRQKLSPDGNSVVGNPEELFYTQNRYRDVAIDPDGTSFYIITDSGGTTSGPSGSSSLSITDLGKILKFTYTPSTLLCTAPTPDVTTLPTIANNCAVTSLNPPTASNNCAGVSGIVGLTDTVFPITKQGNTIVVWKYNYGNGQTTTQNQTVTINNTTWNGSWSNGVPTSQAAIISANYTIDSNFTACSLTVTNNAVVTVNSGINVTLNGPLTVSSGSFILNNNANLFQTTNEANSGNIIVKRNSAPLMRLDYTLWSSPVINQNLLNFSPLTTSTRFYSYNTNTNLYNTIVSPNTTNFSIGQGYLIRMPNTHPTSPTIWNGSFSGIPNNGYLPVQMTNDGVSKRFNLIGNPYASPINMAQFVADNNTKITGTLYFWRKTNGIGAGTEYCTWNGGIFVTNSNAQTVNPNGVIQTGQGFFVEALNSSTSLQFNNSQRIANTTGQFFRTKQTANSNTFWINASNSLGDFSQMAVGYNANATNGIDALDAKHFNESDFAINSLIENQEYVIQTRSLPFDETDIVPLTFKSKTSGNHTISLDHTEGLFSDNQEIILQDNLTGIDTDLQIAPYTFSSELGTDNSRFLLKYQKTLSDITYDNLNNTILIYNKQESIYIKSELANIESILIFDIKGKLLLDKTKINSKEAKIESLKFSNQILIVKVILIDKSNVTKKLMH